MALAAKLSSELMNEIQELRQVAMEVEGDRDALTTKVSALKKTKKSLESKLANRDQMIQQQRIEIDRLSRQNYDISNAVSQIADALSGLGIKK
jgi:uncharacterized coiled-coil DUF342 family protein